MTEFEKYIERLVKGEEVYSEFPKNESSWEELFDFGEKRVAEIVELKRQLSRKNTNPIGLKYLNAICYGVTLASLLWLLFGGR